MQLSIRLCAVLAVLGACGVDDIGEPEVSTVGQQSGTRCPVFYCGDNAPTAGDGLLFDEFSVAGDINYAGIKIESVTVHGYYGGTAIPNSRLWIDGDDLVAIAPDGSQFRGGSLPGTIINLRNNDTGELFELLIDGWDQWSLLYKAGEPGKIPTYLIKSRRAWKGEVKFERYVCNHDALPDDVDWPSALGRWALVYRGDKYDPDHKRVIPENDPNGPWSILACAGSGAGKMHLWRHTYAGSFNSLGQQIYYTTPSQRTTLMKAITADYCGTGAPQFTVAGQPLSFKPNASFSTPALLAPSALDSYEAIWKENGVVCLDEPRRQDFIPGEYAYTRTQVLEKCGRFIPKCAGMTTLWSGYGYAITANPLRR